LKDTVYYATINDITHVLKGIYSNQDLWRHISFEDVFKSAAGFHSINAPCDFIRDIYYPDMDDDKFVSVLNDRPIFPVNQADRTDFEDAHYFPSRDMFAYPLANYLYEPEHSHKYFEINYVLQGECEQIFENERRVLEEGCLSIIAPGSKHSVLICNDDCSAVRLGLRTNIFDSTFFDILSSSSLLSTFFTSVIYGSWQPNYILFKMGADKHITKTIKLIFYELYLSDNYSLKGALSGINMLFCHLLRNYDNVSLHCGNSQQRSSEFPKMLHYMQNNYNGVTLEKLAQQFHYSASHLSRFIKENTGHTYSHIIQSFRLEKAREYLANTNLSIDEITDRIGYKSQSYLSRAFKREYGMSPQYYRKTSEHD
jgi:AraC-like DNA-binding protein